MWWSFTQCPVARPAWYARRGVRWPAELATVVLLACSGPSGAPAAPVPKPAASGSPAAAQPTTPPAPVTLTLSFPSRSAPQVLPIIADDEGFLARQGIQLESTFFQGGPPALQAMIAGAADMTQQITGTTINAIANGADLAIVMGLQADPDYQLYARPEITSVQGLDGKRVASADPGSELNTLVRKTLSYYGLPPERYDLLPIGATNNRYAALTQGAVDATLLSVPLTFDAEARGMRYLGTTSDAVPKYMFTTLATKRDWAGQNADPLVRFIRGYQDFLVWMQDPANREKMVEHWVKLSGASEEAGRQTYDTYVTGPLKNKVLSPDASVDRDGVKAVIDIMLESDILKRPLTVDEVVDMSYWERASRR